MSRLTLPQKLLLTPSVKKENYIMCLIIVADSARPTADELKDADLSNNDGMGIAYQEEGNPLVQYQKGLSLKELTTLTEQVKLPFIAHFRMATHGGVDPALCHPFPITRNVGIRTTGEARELLFHNGIWGDCVKFEDAAQLRGPVSDTRIMAYLLHREGQEHREGVANQIAQQAGKLATFSDQTIERYGSNWITGGKTDETTKGCYYSNDNHLFSYGYCFKGYEYTGV
jgi:predicted glutamine amidotransferase